MQQISTSKTSTLLATQDNNLPFMYSKG